MKNYNEMVAELLRAFPQFKTSEKYKEVQGEEDLPYIIYGAFSDFAISQISINGDVSIRFWNWINEIFNSGSFDKESQNLIQVSLFEPLTSEERLINSARKNLKGDALASFNEASRHFGIEAKGV